MGFLLIYNQLQKRSGFTLTTYNNEISLRSFNNSLEIIKDKCYINKAMS